MFTEFKFSPLQVSEAARATSQAFNAAHPGENPVQFAARTIAARLRARPESFLQYGPYWWAVKAALRALGEDFGPSDDVVLRAAYGGDFYPYDALVAGEQFRDHYNRTFLAGTAQFWLDAEAEQSYVLFDPDMEVRRLGGSKPMLVIRDLLPLAVDLSADDAAVLDAVPGQPVPFAVKFEHEAKLWTAHVYALDSAAAEERVQAMGRSGRLQRAIEFSKTVGDAALDSAEGQPLYVDRAARKVCELAPTGVPAGMVPPAA